ncbi:MAG: YitT family protein [Anaerorhabdus sp.]
MKKIQNYGMVIFGSALFCFSNNLFIAPHNLFNGGFVGISQLLSNLLEYLNMSSINLTSILHFILNIPLFIISYRTLSKKFFIGSLLSVVVITILLALIPISAVPIMSDRLASCIIGGILSGIGTGLILTNGSASGGLDIVGVYLTMKLKAIKVGQMQLVVNIFIYAICAIVYNIEIALYSVIYQAILSFVMDKVYFQNIEVSAMIFTKNQKVKKMIIDEVERGVTYWKGLGGYTHQEREILVTVVSKYEIHRLKRILKENDPTAFMILSDNLQVYGSYKKKLV